jgi:hypothetical protein
MNRRSILSLSAITALGLAMLPGSAVSQQKSLKEQLVGAWTLVSSETTAANGTKQQLQTSVTAQLWQPKPRDDDCQRPFPPLRRLSLYTLLQDAAHERIFLDVVGLGHSAPPYGAGALTSLSRRRANRRCR